MGRNVINSLFLCIAFQHRSHAFVSTSHTGAIGFLGSQYPGCLKSEFYSWKVPYNKQARWPSHGSVSRVSHRALMMAVSLPRDIKDTVNQLRQSMQEGLSARCSRMDIELPYAVNFGVERSKAEKPQVCLNRF